MFTSLLKTAVKNLCRDRLNSFLNLTGLALSFSCFLVIFLYLRNELSVDQHFPDHERIYRLTSELQVAGDVSRHARVGDMIAPLMSQDYEVFEDYVRLQPVGGIGTHLIKDELSSFWQGDTFFQADNRVFDFFDLEVLAGNPATALVEPRKVAISESIARYFFGEEDPIGQSLGVQIASNQFVVDLVFTDLPSNSSHRFDMLFSYSSPMLEPEADGFFEAGIARFNNYSFVRLPADYQVEDFSSISDDFFRRYIETGVQQAFEGQNPRLSFQLQPLDEIYLSPAMEDDVVKGNAIMLYALSAVAVFILGIGCINYMNLATARYIDRAREMGVRRTLGAGRSMLVAQFLTEGLLFSLLSLLIGISLAELLLSGALDRNLLGQDLSIFQGGNLILFWQLLSIGTVIGLLAGSYPACYFSTVKPIDVFRPVVRVSGLGVSLRNIFIALQLLVSFTVIAGAILMYQQVSFLQNKDPGFDRNNKLVVKIIFLPDSSGFRPLMSELGKHPDIVNISMADQVPGTDVYDSSVSAFDEAGEERNLLADSYVVDEHYLDVFQIPLIAGRNFPEGGRSFASVEIHPVLVNETLVRQMGWEEPLGKRISSPASDDVAEVIGVVADFNFASLREEVQPLLLDFFYDDWRWQRFLVIDINPEKAQAVLEFVEETVRTASPENPFQYSFLEDSLSALYADEQYQAQLALAGALVCIGVAVLGLFGLTAFTIDQRSKEIGVRRILGASVGNVLSLLFKGIFLLLICSALLASILVVYALNLWLQEFAYRISISPWVLLSAAGLVMLVAAVPIFYQSLMLSGRKPADALRYE